MVSNGKTIVKSKKWVSLTMAAALLGTTACSSAGDKPGEQKDTGNTAVEQVKAAKFSYVLPGKFVNWMKDMNWIPVLLKETGAEI
ncbi:MAG: hypothetical protein K0S39_6138, partial [Paenibacillus sp.]|nr:hypothetical protein [Paenibacillus sp.]